MFPLITWLSWKAQAVRVGKGNTYQFRLGTPIASHTRIAIGGPCRAWIGHQAGSAVAPHTVVAETTADMRWNDDAIPFLDRGNGRADLFHNAQRLVANHQSIDLAHPSLVDMQIGATDGGRGHAHQDICCGLDAGVLDAFDIDRHVTSPNHCFHSMLSSSFCKFSNPLMRRVPKTKGFMRIGLRCHPESYITTSSIDSPRRKATNEIQSLLKSTTWPKVPAP